MGDECKDGCCQQECECSQERGQKCSCECDCSSEGQYDKLDMLLCMAKEAKFELLKEKIRKRLEAVEGKKLDRAADLLVEAMADYKKSEAESGKKREEFRKRLDAIFSED